MNERHTVVLSDIHLCEAERSEGVWMRYRQPVCSPAPEIGAMLEALRLRVRGQALTLVFNGDVFDFDAPRVIGERSVFHDFPRDAAHARAALAGILDDHPSFVRAVGEVLAEGHEVVFISGNHDAQLTLPAVRALLRDRLTDAAIAARSDAGPRAARTEIEGRILFRSWFHATPDGVIVEHGHQYDLYCTHRYPTAPFRADGQTIQPTLGSLVARHLASRLGYFNPHFDGSYALSLIGYLAHWARYYALSERSLFGTFAVGAMRTVLGLLRARLPASDERRRADLERAAAETGAPRAALLRHAALFACPAEDQLYRALRILWLDRVAIAALSLLAVGLLIALDQASILAAFVAPALFAGYEVVAPKEDVGAVWKRVASAAREVARAHGASAVIFGHTHHAEGSWEDGVFFGNSGSWSAAFRDPECTQPISDERTFIWLTRDEGGALGGGLASFRRGALRRTSDVRAPHARRAARAARGSLAAAGGR